MKPATTIFIVDDEEAVRNSLCRLFRLAGFETRAFSSAEEFLEFYKTDIPGCLLLDVRMPGMDGLELQNILAARKIDIPIVFLTGSGDIPLAVNAMKGGAFDFIEKPFEQDMLLDRIRKAIEFDAQNRRKDSASAEIQQRLAALSARERDVLEGIVAGRSNKLIAQQLGISSRTVEVYRQRLMDKMRAGSVVELVQMVMSSPARRAGKQSDQG
jgi:RNA polymerase sigma factor (sigma-70 family)